MLGAVMGSSTPMTAAPASWSAVTTLAMSARSFGERRRSQLRQGFAGLAHGLFCCAHPPGSGQQQVLWHTVPGAVGTAKEVLRFGHAAAGGNLQFFGCLGVAVHQFQYQAQMINVRRGNPV